MIAGTSTEDSEMIQSSDNHLGILGATLASGQTCGKEKCSFACLQHQACKRWLVGFRIHCSALYVFTDAHIAAQDKHFYCQYIEAMVLA